MLICFDAALIAENAAFLIPYRMEDAAFLFLI